MLKVAFPSFKISKFSGVEFPQNPQQVSVSGSCLLAPSRYKIRSAVPVSSRFYHPVRSQDTTLFISHQGFIRPRGLFVLDHVMRGKAMMISVGFGVLEMAFQNRGRITHSNISTKNAIWSFNGCPEKCITTPPTETSRVDNSTELYRLCQESVKIT